MNGILTLIRSLKIGVFRQSKGKKNAVCNSDSADSTYIVQGIRNRVADMVTGVNSDDRLVSVAANIRDLSCYKRIMIKVFILIFILIAAFDWCLTVAASRYDREVEHHDDRRAEIIHSEPVEDHRNRRRD